MHFEGRGSEWERERWKGYKKLLETLVKLYSDQSLITFCGFQINKRKHKLFYEMFFIQVWRCSSWKKKKKKGRMDIISSVSIHSWLFFLSFLLGSFILKISFLVLPVFSSNYEHTRKNEQREWEGDSEYTSKRLEWKKGNFFWWNIEEKCV